MSYETGLFATQAMDEFLANKPYPFADLVNELKANRPLVRAHFDQARQYTQLLRQAVHAPLLHTDAVADEGEGVHLITRYMNHVKRADQSFIDYDEYTPITHNTMLYEDEALDMRRAFPLHFASQNIETTFNAVSKNSLYQGGGFAGTIAMGVVLAHALDGVLTANMPIAIPHSEGLFLGTAEPADPATYAPKNYNLVRPFKDQMVHMTQPYMFTPFWKPQVALNLYSFVPDRALSRDQILLANLFEDEVYDKQQTVFATGAFLQSYTSAGHTIDKQHYADVTGYLKRIMGRVINSSEWKAATSAPKLAVSN